VKRDRQRLKKAKRTARTTGGGAKPAGETEVPEIDALLSLLGSVRSVQRAVAVDLAWGACAFHASKSKTFLPLIRSGLLDSDWQVRDISAEALGEVGNRRDVHALAALLRDPEWVVRASAVSSLSSFPSRRTAILIARCLKEDREPTVRRYAATALLVSQKDRALPELLAQFTVEKSELAKVGISHSLTLLGEPTGTQYWLDSIKNWLDQRFQFVYCGLHEDIINRATYIDEHREIIRSKLELLSKDTCQPIVKELVSEMLWRIGSAVTGRTH